MTGRIKLNCSSIRQYAHFAGGIHAPGQYPLAHERVTNIIVLISDDNALVVAHAEIAQHGHCELVNMTGVHFLKADPESRRTASRFESMQIDNPGNSQGLRKMLQKIRLKEV